METRTIYAQKSIALIAHDNRKDDLIAWVSKNERTLSRHFLCGTGSTAKMVTEATGLPVKAYRSGPLGGDQKIGSLIADLAVDFLIFFWDPLTTQPHDPDVKALLRIAVLYNIPVAMNQSTADFLFSSTLMDQDYARALFDYRSRIKHKE
ncbi:MAG: methylglyoxal synthase [Eubacteriales bacterium]|nr:methylglyoxal synthase [Eubacteriales bacterium]